MSVLESETQIGGLMPLLRRYCREAESAMELPGLTANARRTLLTSILADLGEAMSRAKEAGLFWRPQSEVEGLREWFAHACEVAQELEGALRLLDESGTTPSYYESGVE